MPSTPQSRFHNAPGLRVSNTLKPIIRTYGWTLLSVTAPRVLALLVSVVQGKRTIKHATERIFETFGRQLGLDRLPASFAILVSGTVFLPRLIASAVGYSPYNPSASKLYWSTSRLRFLRFFCTFITGLISFALLNRRKKSLEENYSAHSTGTAGHGLQVAHEAVESNASEHKQAHSVRSVPLAGRTIDLTFFGMVRATDICLRSLWSYFIPRGKSNRTLQIARLVDRMAAPVLFTASSSIIMWAWFYSPYNLPKSYQAWISRAAQLDARLLQALRECRTGDFVYGKDTGRGELLRPLCRELGYPEEWGDPACCEQVPCKVSHCGTGDSCEWHAISRLTRAWLFAIRMYLPLNLLIFTRRKPSGATTSKALKEASQSSAFLAAFVALFYYGVCLARRRAGPKLLPNIKPQAWDSGLSVGLGCALCGTSIILEKPSRRQEIAFFVAPRALATAFPRKYDRQYIWREQMAYATCAAVILTAAVEFPRQVRGVFGRFLSQLLT